MTSGEALLVLSAVAVGLGATVVSIREYRRSIKSTEIDFESVRKFVESAPPIPQHLLKPIANERPGDRENDEEDDPYKSIT
ncbi:hypothetical protein BV911_17530 [Pseudoruegeria sp. SK021]|nr:hypothetical protein BV911_17530 [Pseudoruegeria sp. SK021]